ncbi:hypothetical protein HS9_03597 [Bacillus velezensis]|nr:hypothetical protein HS9_03597 [Bacillus velezensis]
MKSAYTNSVHGIISEIAHKKRPASAGPVIQSSIDFIF